jgi:hypothetical protein
VGDLLESVGGQKLVSVKQFKQCLCQFCLTSKTTDETGFMKTGKKCDCFESEYRTETETQKNYCAMCIIENAILN